MFAPYCRDFFHFMAKENTFYFSHDVNARNDPKLIKLLMKHGIAGIGIFWCLIEMLYENNGELLTSECDSYAFALHTDYDVVNSVINNFDLFQKNDKAFWSERVNDNMYNRKFKSEKAKLSASLRWNKSKNNANALKNNANALPTQSECNAIKERKGKEIEKNNNSKELLLEKHKIENGQDYILSFEKFEKWIEENTPFVATMKHPISFEDFLKIRGLIPINGKKTIIPSEDVRTFLMNIQNNKVYQKKYTSPFLCINLWYKNKNIQK